MAALKKFSTLMIYIKNDSCKLTQVCNICNTKILSKKQLEITCFCNVIVTIH